MLVAARGQEEKAVAILVGDPLADREGRAGIGQEFERADIGGEHGAHGEGGLRVLGIDDRLGDGALHRFGKRRQFGLQQMLHQHPVAGLALLPEHAGAVGEELPRGGDPEGIDGVLLLRDEGGGHHVEVARGCALRGRATSGARGRRAG